MGYTAGDMASGLSGNWGYPKRAVLVGQMKSEAVGLWATLFQHKPRCSDVTLF